MVCVLNYVAKTFAAIASVVIVSSAFADVPGKTAINTNGALTPIVDETASLVKQFCGCPIKVTVVEESYPSTTSMKSIGMALTAIHRAAFTQCKTEAKKKAFCANLSEFVLSAGSCPKCADAPVYSERVIKLQSSDDAFNSAEQIGALLGKW